MPHMHPFDADFEDSPALCSTCARVVSKLSAFPCHNCGFFVCERCLDKARQCPKCLMGSIDDYSCFHHNDSYDTAAAAAATGTSKSPDCDANDIAKKQKCQGAAEGEPLYHMLEGGEGNDDSEFDPDSPSVSGYVREENIYQALEDFVRPVTAEKQDDEEADGGEELNEMSSEDCGLERQACKDESTTSQQQEGYAVVAKPILKRSGALEDDNVGEEVPSLKETQPKGCLGVKESKPLLEEMSRIARLRQHFEPNGK